MRKSLWNRFSARNDGVQNSGNQYQPAKPLLAGRSLGKVNARKIEDFIQLTNDVFMCARIGEGGNRIAYGTSKGFVSTSTALPSQLISNKRLHFGTISDCAILEDGRVLSSSWDSSLRLWYGENLERSTEFRSTYAELLCCAVSPDNKFFAAGDANKSGGRLDIWNLTTLQKQHSFNGHTSGVSSCAVSPDNRFLLSSGFDGTTRLWEIGQSVQKYSVATHKNGLPGKCSFSPANNCFVVSSWDGSLRARDLATGASIWRRSLDDAILGLAISCDGRYLATTTMQRNLRITDMATGNEVCSLAIPDLAFIVPDLPFSPYGVQFFPENDLLLIYGGKADPGTDIYAGAAMTMRLLEV